MEMSPQRVRTAEFKTARKGADLDEVRSFLNDVADELERAQNQSTAMEARARAAVARLQEVSEGKSADVPPPPPAPTAAPEATEVPAEQTDAIGRTLVLAQRTADSLIAEARAEAARVVAAANGEAATTRDSTREMAATMLDEAREEARRVGETERLAVASEVDSLKARRDFLESDVDHLEQFLVAQRSRVRDAAAELIEITDRVPAGLGDARRPLLSASDDGPAADAIVHGDGVGVGRDPTTSRPDPTSRRGRCGGRVGGRRADTGDPHRDRTRRPRRRCHPGRFRRHVGHRPHHEQRLPVQLRRPDDRNT